MALSTRVHGLIDYAAAITLGGLAVSGILSAPTRRVATLATAVPVTYFLLTDYEAGLVGHISMRQHLKLDVAEGILLAAAGLLMRRQPPASRAILTFYGLAQFTLGLSTTSKVAARPGQSSGPLARLLGQA